MKLGYFYLHNNLPVISTERKPELEHIIPVNWQRTMVEWESQLVTVKNAIYIGKWLLRDNGTSPTMYELIPGLKVKHSNGHIFHIYH